MRRWPLSDATPEDPHNVRRFVDVQERDYEQALSEIRSGRKRSHWMWYVFPQFAGLGMSATSQHYAVKSLAETEAYLAHPVLGPRLMECVEAVLAIEGRSAFEILGSPDDMKLRSCAALVAEAAVHIGRAAFVKSLDDHVQHELPNRGRPHAPAVF